MSFWSKSPGPHLSHYLKSIFTGPSEPKLLINTSKYEPINNPLWTITQATDEDIPLIVEFWRHHFRRPNSPLCIVDPDDIRGQNQNILLVAKGSDSKIIGTIMSQPLGQLKRIGVSKSWTTFRARWIDMFCVHHNMWHKGLGSDLLTAIHKENAALGQEVCFFMKEGSPLSMPSLRASTFVYRIVTKDEITSKVEEWTPDQLLTFAQTITTKSQCFIHSVTSGTKSKIFSYNGCRGRIIAAFVAGHERDHYGIKPILWNSGFIKHGELMDSEIAEAATQLSAAAAYAFDSPYVWMDSRHLGKDVAEKGKWSIDGSYHMYAYHMDTGIYFNGDIFLIL